MQRLRALMIFNNLDHAPVGHTDCHLSTMHRLGTFMIFDDLHHAPFGHMIMAMVRHGPTWSDYGPTMVRQWFGDCASCFF